jgi:RNA polymerase sigma-70 factor (ECF subfamily)
LRYTRYIAAKPSLHRDDLALARACAQGDEAAWDTFIRTYRPVLYRAADALDPGGRARDLADSLYAELYGLKESGGERRSLFAYYEGRSSLATWLRAVLSQRFIDRMRAERRLDPLPQQGSREEPASAALPPDPDAARDAALLQQALDDAVGELPARDRLRLACYYAQDLTLAETGRLLEESEATVSRQLARSRRAIRGHVETRLRAAGLDEAAIVSCVTAAAEDPGTIDLTTLLQGARKESAPDRSKDSR